MNVTKGMQSGEWLFTLAALDELAALTRNANVAGGYPAIGIGGHGVYGACARAAQVILSDLFGEITGNEIWEAMIEYDFSARFAIVHQAHRMMRDEFEEREYHAANAH